MAKGKAKYLFHVSMLARCFLQESRKYGVRVTTKTCERALYYYSPYSAWMWYSLLTTHPSYSVHSTRYRVATMRPSADEFDADTVARLAGWRQHSILETNVRIPDSRDCSRGVYCFASSFSPMLRRRNDTCCHDLRLHIRSCTGAVPPKSPWKGSKVAS